MVPHVTAGLGPFLVDVDAVDRTHEHAHRTARAQLGNDHDVEATVEYRAELRRAVADTGVTRNAFRRLDTTRWLLPGFVTRSRGDPAGPPSLGFRENSFCPGHPFLPKLYAGLS